ncbi:uncharacterized protein CCOS01_05697 [Colletotrichum costaricense]|uniref:Uncharacterized protein n=1 Tax=Colletotrichum costaricense TaxID=1209916 RepID=A0AAJ0E3F0_9PEZI|nr:uncharacterized protein CCOS01_05697 [Colletotrichum costaricense]KAK1530594.1 hypothetical protein CCOS01_05697 [Colletotrichum costaricense]
MMASVRLVPCKNPTWSDYMPLGIRERINGAVHESAVGRWEGGRQHGWWYWADLRTDDRRLVTDGKNGLAASGLGKHRGCEGSHRDSEADTYTDITRKVK